MVAAVDKDHSGTIDFHEFLAIMIKKMSETDKKEALDEAFLLFDKDGDGDITFDDLKAVAEELNENLTDEEINEMLAGASQNRNAQGQLAVSDQAFKQMLSKQTDE